MPFIPVPNTALVELLYTWSGQEVENTLWFSRPDNLDQSELTTLAQAMLSWWRTEAAPLQSSDLRLREVLATDMSVQAGFQGQAPGTITDVGGGSSPTLPTSNTLTVSFRTGLRGRHHRGRNYVVGAMESQVIGSTWQLLPAQGWLDAYTAIKDYVEPLGWTWVVVSQYFDNAPRAIGLTFPITTVVLTDDVVDSQRRRLPGRGR